MNVQCAVEVCRRSSFFGCNILMANHSKELKELIGVKVQIFGLPAKCERLCEDCSFNSLLLIAQAMPNYCEACHPVLKALLSSLALGRPASSQVVADDRMTLFALCHLMTSVFALGLLLVVLLLAGLWRRCFSKCPSMLVFALHYHTASCCIIFSGRSWQGVAQMNKCLSEGSRSQCSNVQAVKLPISG